MEYTKDEELVHQEQVGEKTGLEDLKQTGDREKIVSALEDEILPGVPLNRDPAFEAALVRKFDRRLLLMMVGIYIMNFLDRGNIAYAASSGLKKDLKLDSVQYSTVLSLL